VEGRSSAGKAEVRGETGAKPRPYTSGVGSLHDGRGPALSDSLRSRRTCSIGFRGPARTVNFCGGPPEKIESSSVAGSRSSQWIGMVRR
jgi:hypothetical protein